MGNKATQIFIKVHRPFHVKICKKINKFEPWNRFVYHLYFFLIMGKILSEKPHDTQQDKNKDLSRLCIINQNHEAEGVWVYPKCQGFVTRFYVTNGTR